VNVAVVDTNVPVVANGKSRQAGPSCVTACIQALSAIQQHGKLVVDDRMYILSEYMKNLSFSGQPGFGDAFFKWVFDNQANESCCERVAIHPKDNDNFNEFPEDPELKGFDRSDRKFVAAARASASSPPILNAVDSDWWNFRDVLHRHGLKIEFLCPEQFQKKK